MAASLSELKKACPGASAEFLMGQVEAEATVEQARGDFIAQLQLDVEARDGEIKTLKSQIEELQSENKSLKEKSGSGGAGVPSGSVAPDGASREGKGGEGTGSAEDEYQAAVKAAQDSGLKRREAVAHVARTQPELTAARAEEYTRKHRRKIAK